MLYRKISRIIENHLLSNSNKMLIIDGARQIGKSYIIRHIGQKLFPNYIEINMEEDKLSRAAFSKVRTTEDFYMVLSSIAGEKMLEKENTLVFIDEIQAYEQLLTLVKFLIEDNRFTYIASGSQLGIALKNTQSLPLGSIIIERMYPLDFEEFIRANGVGDLAINAMRQMFVSNQSLPDALHNRILDLFKKYLLVGGLPDAVNEYLSSNNIVTIRKIQNFVHNLYGIDAIKYEQDNGKKLKIRRIFDMIPSTLENKKKRLVVRSIEDKNWKKYRDYLEEFDFLISSGISLDVNAISQPSYPLEENVGKNLLKLYLNDVGILSAIFYKNNIKSILDDDLSINLGTIYETVVAQELKAHGYKLFYYDNKKNGEIDFLIDDVENLSNIPLEIKSGKDYTVHSALDTFLSIPDYNIHKAYVLSNEQKVFENKGIIYIPIYYIMFFDNNNADLVKLIQ